MKKYGFPFTNLLIFLFTLLWALPSLAAETVVYSEGFESNEGGYTILEGTNSAQWEWGTPAPSPAVGPQAAHAGIKCWGTNLAGTLPRPSDSSIVSPAISLPALSANQVIRVRFWAFVSIDGMYDRGQFFISKDKVSWQSLAQFYNNMETTCDKAPQWKKYEFGIPANYANGTVYLRFRAAVQYSNSTFYCPPYTPDDLSGVYIDDIAITYYEVTGTQKVFSLEAWEDDSTWASCPWIAPWNGTEFQIDNDIYSVARYSENEYTDSYKLTVNPVAQNGVYRFEVQERQQEQSFTDYVALTVIDHASGVAVAPDEDGKLHAWYSAKLVPPSSATAAGNDVLSLVATADDNGFPAYSDDTVELSFNSANLRKGATLILRAAGFIIGEGSPKPYTGPPAIIVETKDSSGAWVERGRFRPRFAYSVAAFDLTPFVNKKQTNITVRLRSVSHDVKYHAIDFVAIAVGKEPPFKATTLRPSKAYFGAQNVLDTLLSSDSNYLEMNADQKYSLEFPAPKLAKGKVREFAFISKGYYIPKGGSYLIYTWDGQQWVQRDGSSYPSSDTNKTYDLSLFLPDAAGEYKIRIWQDYQYEAGGIDYVKMMVGSDEAPLNYAWDFRSSSSILSLLKDSDDDKTYWSSCPRDRIVEVRFTPPGPANIPPTTNPVFVTNTTSTTPTINWTYNDSDGDLQAQSQIQVWTGPGATGSIIWNPSVFYGTGTSEVYNGLALSSGTTYYARVQAYDGKDWGPWSESAFTINRQICGDLNSDGAVNTLDYAIFKTTFGKSQGQAGYNAAADFDSDGIVSLKDYSYWYNCYVTYR